MDLILWRHAEAFDPRAAGDDLDRALTPKGERHALRLAEWLQPRLPAATRVLVSPARRAQQTAAALDRPRQTVPAMAPGGTVEGLLRAAGWPDAPEAVLVVGHQPTLGWVVARLLAGNTAAWTLRKGAFVWLRRRGREGEAQALLHASLGVDLL